MATLKTLRKNTMTKMATLVKNAVCDTNINCHMDVRKGVLGDLSQSRELLSRSSSHCGEHGTFKWNHVIYISKLLPPKIVDC